jgi:hypothetical protein
MLHMLALEKKGLIKERVVDALINNPKSKLLKDAQKVMDGATPPELSPLMRLSRSMEQVTSGISSSLYATKSTLKIISKKQKGALAGYSLSLGLSLGFFFCCCRSYWGLTCGRLQNRNRAGEMAITMRWRR